MATGGAERRSGRQTRFFVEYERCGDGPRAALLAGYSERTAEAVARRLLGAPRTDEGKPKAARPPAGLAEPADHPSCDPQPLSVAPITPEERKPRQPTAGSPASEDSLPACAQAAPAMLKLVDVTRDMVLSGLFAEATSQGKESSQTCRVKAWELLAKALGLFGQAGSSDDGDEPLTVRFDIRLDEPDNAVGCQADQDAGQKLVTIKPRVQGNHFPGGRESERGQRPLSVLSSTTAGGGK